MKSSTASSSGAVDLSYTYNPPAGGAMLCGGKPGQVCTSTDGNGHVTTNAYDSSGNLTTVTPPTPLGASSSTYDTLGRVATHTDGKGQVSRYSYDGLNRVTQVQLSGITTCTSGDIGAGNCLKYTYDSDGNVLTQVDQTGTTTYTYDLLGREATRSLPGQGLMTLTYDPAGNVLSQVDGTGTVTYGYDNANELTSLAEPGGSCTGTVSLCTTFGYDNNGTRTTTTYPTSPATVMTVTPSNSGQVKEIKAVAGSTTLTDFTYTYDYTPTGGTARDGGLTSSRTDAVAALTTTYGYDNLNRLTSAVEKNSSATTTASWSYGYDNAGNRTSATIAGASVTFGYNNASELTSRQGSATGWSYDANGNETSAVGATTRTAETWNNKDQLTSATTDGTATPFTYTGLGQAARLSAGTTNYRNGQTGITAQTVSGATTSYTRDPSGALIAEHLSTGGSYYYLYDGLGSVVGLVNNTGNKVNKYSYDPYGISRSKNETIFNPYQFIGEYADSVTGLYKLGARYYDPALGRFTQPDPSHQESNAYAYAACSPESFVDRDGLSLKCALAGGVYGAVGALIGGTVGSLAGPVGTAAGGYVGGSGAGGFAYGVCSSKRKSNSARAIDGLDAAADTIVSGAGAAAGALGLKGLLD